MQCVMYHYVRPDTEGLPSFRYLALDDFRRQLDFFAAAGRFLSREECLSAASGGEVDGVVLSFDDGLRDHYRWVFPELRARGLWGFFFASTGPYRTGALLDVHRTHLLLGKEGGAAMMRRISGLGAAVAENLAGAPYAAQQNDADTAQFKRIMNYGLHPAARGPLLDALMKDVFGGAQPGAESFYLQPGELREMDAAGMIIGSHTVSHPVLSRLTIDEQESEIRNSFRDLAGILGKPITTFAYPYGGRHTFTFETQRLLERHGCRLAFAVEECGFAIPRYDCNQFPHGRARMGGRENSPRGAALHLA